MTSTTFAPLMVAPAQVRRGAGILASMGDIIASLGERPLVIGGDLSLSVAAPFLTPAIASLAARQISYGNNCSEASLERLKLEATEHDADFMIGVGGGKALDTAKLIAHQLRLPVVTIPTSAATCAAWTALSNVYSEAGAFLYDVALDRCPDLLILDYDLVATAPQRTLIAGIGDALAKWYEGSVSSGSSDHTLVIAAVQQARVLRDLLFQKTPAALAEPGGSDWREVVDACVLLAGVMGGLGGAQCRTVAAHAVHNGLTHLSKSHGILHGEKVAYGILVQLRLEEIAQQSSLAYAARQQLIQFYEAVGLPRTLADMNMAEIRIKDLQHAAAIACRPGSDIFHLPFSMTPEALMGALVTTTATEIKPTAAGTSITPVLTP
ncbi:iron-containing alcohol dehydrogenase family protein [Oscillatoria sp. CS-180]|uniref:iron-containing alcohol dehydrogenase family protein n=1 Tax=Oscillatoria sp. CS-180 TaxID=3021720 RepID=UPI00233058A8|nr:iron-containing alcohol dehydrogenase family protein [Oscillatoria sp. CS-180]MDB9527362.1 iron-containing alcohol dehydrogenase family protein [Oscillatoria sp. CS-180]